MKNRTVIFVKLSKIPTGTAQQRKMAYNPRINKVMTYPSKSYSDAKKTYYNAFKMHRPEEPFKAPISLNVNLLYPTKDKKKQNTFKTTKPDGDNLLKVIKDVLNDLGFFVDDANVSVEKISRMWVEPERGGIQIEVNEL